MASVLEVVFVAKRPSINRRSFLGVAVGTVAVAAVGCGGDDGGEAAGVGGSGSGGAGTGGAGTGGVGTGGAGTGGAGTGGAGTGGAGTGGAGTGGAATGGTATGGAGTGGAGTGGAGTGGAATGGATGGAATGGAGTGGVATGGAATGGAAGAATGGAGGAGSESGLVALVRGTDVIQATQDAIAAMGGFPDLTGRTVMLRPNAIDTAPPGSVNPDVIRGVIRAVRAAGTPSSIIVADDTFTGATLTRMQNNGILAAAEAEGATCVGLEGGATTLSSPAGANEWSGGIPFYSAVLEVDYLINVPVCKTHGSANFSMALKAWYGNVPSSARNQSHMNVTTISNTMAEMHLVKQEDFVVLDATSCLLTGGPQVGNGTVAQPGIVVASRDPILADVTGLCILKHYLEQTGTSNSRITNSTPWAQPQIVRAMALTALGFITGQQRFPYASQGIDEIDTIMSYRD